VIWLLVSLLLILAIGSGVALSKFLFLLLIVALVVALFGAFGRTTYCPRESRTREGRRMPALSRTVVSTRL